MEQLGGFLSTGGGDGGASPPCDPLVVADVAPGEEQDVVLGGAIQMQALLAQFYKSEVRVAYLGGSLGSCEYSSEILAALDVFRDQLLLSPIQLGGEDRGSGCHGGATLVSNLLGKVEWTPEEDGYDLGGLGWTYAR